MRLRVSGTFAPDVAEQVEAMVRAGIGTTDHRLVAVHVKARPVQVSWSTDCIGPACRVGAWFANTDTGAGGHRGMRRRDLARLDLSAHTTPVRVERQDSYTSGRAYPGVPGIARVPRGTRYLVTLIVPQRPDLIVDRFPRERVYRGRKTSPAIPQACWHDDVFAVAAHEAKHVEQFRAGTSRSENAADRHALGSLRRRGPCPVCAPEDAR